MFSYLENPARRQIEILFNGKPCLVASGISVASALLAVTRIFRTTPVSGSNRGPYCMMGICFDCLVTIDGVANQQACLIMVEAGMQIQTQSGAAAVATATAT